MAGIQISSVNLQRRNPHFFGSAAALLTRISRVPRLQPFYLPGSRLERFGKHRFVWRWIFSPAFLFRTVSAAVAVSRLATIIFAPACAKARQIPLPIPRPPPVTIAVLPVKSNTGKFMLANSPFPSVQLFFQAPSAHIFFLIR